MTNELAAPVSNRVSNPSRGRSSARQSACFAVEAQKAQAAGVLAVRIGINPGNPVERSDDIFGVAVAVAARLCALAEPGQILVSGVVRELVEDPNLTACMHDAGRRPIRGLESALQVYRVEWQSV